MKFFKVISGSGLKGLSVQQRSDFRIPCEDLSSPVKKKTTKNSCTFVARQK